MPCRRKSGSIETLVHSVINSLSPLDIEDATGKTADFYYKVSNPNHQQQLSLKDAEKLDLKLIEIGKDPVFFRHYQITARRMANVSGNPVERFMDLSREVGEVAAALQSKTENRRILKEAYDILDAAQDLVNAIEGVES